jgi:hypothetical protein
VRRFLTVTLCYKVSIIPCYLQEVLMRKSLTRQRVVLFSRSRGSTNMGLPLTTQETYRWKFDIIDDVLLTD